jgi:hypothetical protein
MNRLFRPTTPISSDVQINTLHWHIVDSQSFPLVIPGFQGISERGAYNKKAIYTPADVKEITDYAAAVSHQPPLTNTWLRTSYLEGH